MSDLTKREPVYDPQELERQLVIRENAGDGQVFKPSYKSIFRTTSTAIEI